MRIKRAVLIKYIAVVIALFLAADPLAVLAADMTDEAFFFEEDDNTSSSEEAYSPDIDKEALYNSIDVERLRTSIDVDALLSQIDEDELLSQIDEDELRAELARREAESESYRDDFEIESGTIDLTRDKEKDLPPNVTRIEFPIIENNNIFDFIMDPLGLVYMTNAAKYGGGKVEEKATVLFKNTGSDYLFSATSDYLSFRNKGNVPVMVTIKASLSETGNLRITDSRDFEEMSDAALYLALTDNEGNEIPLYADREVTIETMLLVSDKDSTVYKWNPETSSFESTYYDNPEDEGVYFFALTGACNSGGDWQQVNASPKVKVSWSARALNGEEITNAARKDNDIADDKKADSSDNVDTSETAEVLELEDSEENHQESASKDASDEISEESSEEASEENSEETSAKADEAKETGSDEPDAEDTGAEEETAEAPARRLTLEEAKLEELRREKLEELKQQKLQELIEEKLKELIQAEFEALYERELQKRRNASRESENSQPPKKEAPKEDKPEEETPAEEATANTSKEEISDKETYDEGIPVADDHPENENSDAKVPEAAGEENSG